MRVIFLCLALLAGCASDRVVVDHRYVEADEQTFTTVAEEWAGYVEADPKKDEQERKLARLLVRSWGARINTAKGGAR